MDQLGEGLTSSNRDKLKGNVRGSAVATKSEGSGRRPKKQQQRDDPGRQAYMNVEVNTRLSTGCPGTPHRLFESSYDVRFRQKEFAVQGDAVTSERQVAANEVSISVDQVVHRHVNGLCIVTAGETFRDILNSAGADVTISNVHFVKKESDAQSVGAKRKKAKKSKYARNKSNGKENEMDSTEPSETLAKITLSNGSVVDLKCCVLGTVLELNHRLDGKSEQIEECSMKTNPSLLVTDPLLDGFLAVILPTGSFPFRPEMP